MSDFVVQSVSPSSPADFGSMIRVVGIGGGGCNSLQYMINQSLQGVEFIAVNTDAQTLNRSTASLKVQIGVRQTNGLGAGGNPYKGREAAEESREDLKQILQDSKIVFLTTGLGGGTGTGATPVVAQIAKELGALTIAVVTRPFYFEGRNRTINANAGITELTKYVDSIVVVDNDKLLKSLGQNISVLNAFNEANAVLYNAVRGISDAITGAGFINLDLADVDIIMRSRGHALIGLGRGRGVNFIADAVHNAVHNPLMSSSDVKRATGMLVNAHVSPNFPILNWDMVNTQLLSYTDPEADIKCGLIFDDSLNEDEIEITIIITGFNSNDDAYSGSSQNITRAHAIPQNLGSNTPLPVKSMDDSFLRKNVQTADRSASAAPVAPAAQAATYAPSDAPVQTEQQYAKAVGSDFDEEMPEVFRNKI
ncbi:cell division protein FtsZ [Anaerobiospirillum succiniciproducens]|uniref:cell division protein FtsZ n=1 Tax=Anaerobiospirillum succiniciproducens TaxID=13335 RepID=UPI0026DAE07F|nr:cell division protein FtsZ [Anaerobiospirillum succiniciproducens]MDO4676133.1 cell division protein FtsZ [Anaerobiospirillum succiniciproducens]